MQSVGTDHDFFRSLKSTMEGQFGAWEAIPGTRELLEHCCLHVPSSARDEGNEARVFCFDALDGARSALQTIGQRGSIPSIVWDPDGSVTLAELDQRFAFDPLVEQWAQYTRGDFEEALKTSGLLEGWVENGAYCAHRRREEPTFGFTVEDPSEEPILRAALMLIGIRPIGDRIGLVVNGVPERRVITLTNSQLYSLRRGGVC